MKSVHALFYSPTAASEKIALEIAAALAGDEAAVKEHNLTLPGSLPASTAIAPADLAVMAVPVYAGRVAPLAAERLAAFQGTDTPALIAVLYGNREYEDALLELYDIATSQSFRVVGAGAFIGEHSFSSPDQPIAPGRPDESDLQKARDLASLVLEKLADDPAASCTRALLPGNTPYKEGMGDIPITPMVDYDNCTLCGECLKACPSGAIEIDDRVVMEMELCTFCCACIKSCPEQAVSRGEAGPVTDKARWLHQNCALRKEPELFVGDQTGY